MSVPDITCQDEQRRHKAHAVLNGIDYVEVTDDQRTLHVYFFRAAPTDLKPENVLITGGARIATVNVVDIQPCPDDQRNHEERLHIKVEKPGDFSTYTLRLVQIDSEGGPTSTPLAGFDPRYSQVQFSFKASCPSDLDCRQSDPCPPPARQEPEIDYLAKDYASFRQLLLDRLSVVMPGWTERHIPDLGIALVELLAYVGDYLSYQQDAVATEAYLATARRRISVRRHVRLVDYQLHEGTNARAWIHVWTGEDFVGNQVLEPGNIFFISADIDLPALSMQVLSLDDLRNIPFDRFEIYEPIDQKTKIALYARQSQIAFHTWGDRQCCLPKEATKATLKDVASAPAAAKPQNPETRKDEHGKPEPRQQTYEPPKPPDEPPETPSNGLALKIGDYLLFEEIRGAETGNPADADPTRRHVVRLTLVTPGFDEVEQQAIVDIEWAEEDALPFPLCLSAIVGPECKCVDISVARGNMVLVDHGRTIEGEPLGTVPRTMLATGCEGANCPGEISVAAGRFHPELEWAPLVFALPLDRDRPASQQLVRQPDARSATPSIRVTSIPPQPGGDGPLVPLDLFHGGNWDAFQKVLRNDKAQAYQYLRSWLGLKLRTRLNNATLDVAELRKALAGLIQEWEYDADLLGSTGQDRHYTIEVDNERRVHLRFGDGELGRRPEAGTAFEATYRIGNAVAGNVGAERISRIAFRNGAVHGVDLRPRNPLPAVGGTAPETLAEARLFAPQRFRTDLLRAITADDYARLAEQRPKVHCAAAALRWTGNGYEALVAIDQRNRAETEQSVLTDVADWLDSFRRIGHNVRTVPARLIALYIKMTVCVLPHYLQAHVKAAVLDILGNRQLPDGSLGLFHPDNLTFGQTIFLSPIAAMVHALPGVESVTIDRLERQFDGPAGEVARGLLAIGPLEIARLDNDPNFPENGRIELDMRGGR